MPSIMEERERKKGGRGAGRAVMKLSNNIPVIFIEIEIARKVARPAAPSWSTRTFVPP